MATISGRAAVARADRVGRRRRRRGEEAVGQPDLLRGAVADVELGVGSSRASEHGDHVVPAGLAGGAVDWARSPSTVIDSVRAQRGRACATPWPRRPGPRPPRGGRSAGAGRRAQRRPRRSAPGRPPSTPRRRPGGRPCGARPRSASSSTPSAAAASAARLVSSRRTRAGAVPPATPGRGRAQVGAGAHGRGHLVGQLQPSGRRATRRSNAPAARLHGSRRADATVRRSARAVARPR